MSYVLIPASKSTLRRALRFVVGKDFWMTYRLPFQKLARVTHPDRFLHPENHATLTHELVHVEQFTHWWGPMLLPLLVTLFPLPVIFSGRWLVERHAYLADIKSGRMTLDAVVELLWTRYGWCWPRSMMRRWFSRRLAW